MVIEYLQDVIQVAFRKVFQEPVVCIAVGKVMSVIRIILFQGSTSADRNVYIVERIVDGNPIRDNALMFFQSKEMRVIGADKTEGCRKHACRALKRLINNEFVMH